MAQLCKDAVASTEPNGLSAISFLLHKILEEYGYVDINDGGDVYRIVVDATNTKFLQARPLEKGDERKSCETMYDAMTEALKVTRSVEECTIYCGPVISGEWFRCSHFGVDADEEIIDSYVTEFAEDVTKGYDSCTVEETLRAALEFLRHGECADDWYDLWNEGSFADAAKHWPEAPLYINYFADTEMFCPER